MLPSRQIPQCRFSELCNPGIEVVAPIVVTAGHDSPDAVMANSLLGLGAEGSCRGSGPHGGQKSRSRKSVPSLLSASFSGRPASGLRKVRLARLLRAAAVAWAS